MLQTDATVQHGGSFHSAFREEDFASRCSTTYLSSNPRPRGHYGAELQVLDVVAAVLEPGPDEEAREIPEEEQLQVQCRKENYLPLTNYKVLE